MELMIRAGSGRYRRATKNEVQEVAAQYIAAGALGQYLASPMAAQAYVKPMLAGRDHEVFMALFLNTRHRLIGVRELFRGTLDGASVHPREVVKEALDIGAASVILAHNHPSGVADPSYADEQITIRLRDALALVDIRVLDHLIVAGDAVTSLAARGLI